MAEESYAGMAELYDALMDGVDYDRWARCLAGWIDSYYKKEGQLRVLDCACGTGAITLRLAALGMELTGLDLSEDMLRVAQQKAMARGLRIPFVRMDMQRIALHRRMDVITCCCDGVNYLTDTRAAERFFQSAHASLVPNGLLLFDISSRHKLEHVLGRNILGEDRLECTYLWENMFDPKTRLLEMRLHFFVPDGLRGRYRRFDERHLQRAYTAEELTGLLQRCGFETLAVTEAFSDEPPSETAERIQFVARRMEA